MTSGRPSPRIPEDPGQLREWHKQEIKRLFPELGARDIEEAEINLRRYVEVLIRIADRLADEEALTQEAGEDTMGGKVEQSKSQEPHAKQ